MTLERDREKSMEKIKPWAIFIFNLSEYCIRHVWRCCSQVCAWLKEKCTVSEWMWRLCVAVCNIRVSLPTRPHFVWVIDIKQQRQQHNTLFTASQSLVLNEYWLECHWTSAVEKLTYEHCNVRMHCDTCSLSHRKSAYSYSFTRQRLRTAMLCTNKASATNENSGCKRKNWQCFAELRVSLILTKAR